MGTKIKCIVLDHEMGCNLLSVSRMVREGWRVRLSKSEMTIRKGCIEFQKVAFEDGLFVLTVGQQYINFGNDLPIRFMHGMPPRFDETYFSRQMNFLQQEIRIDGPRSGVYQEGQRLFALTKFATDQHFFKATIEVILPKKPPQVLSQVCIKPNLNSNRIHIGFVWIGLT